MKRSGAFLRTWASRWCDAITLERLIDPILADVQLEYDDALRRGCTWRARWIRLRGHFTFVRVLLTYGGERAMEHLSAAEVHQIVTSTVLRCIAMVTVATGVLLAGPLFSSYVARPENATFSALALLIPQALPLSIPVGITLGIACGPQKVTASPWALSIVMLIALTASLVSFANLGWIAPTTNYTFRAALSGGPVTKGASELTLSELHRLIRVRTHQPFEFYAGESRRLSLELHTRLSLACAPVVLALFALSIACQRHRRRATLVVSTSVAVLGYWAIFNFARVGYPEAAAYAVAWSPNLTYVLLSLIAVGFAASRRRLTSATV